MTFLSSFSKVNTQKNLCFESHFSYCIIFQVIFEKYRKIGVTCKIRNVKSASKSKCMGCAFQSYIPTQLYFSFLHTFGIYFIKYFTAMNVTMLLLLNSRRPWSNKMGKQSAYLCPIARSVLFPHSIVRLFAKGFSHNRSDRN